ncbi:ABC transporter substrate-binding protein [Christensenellaceae bacterium OttesenSCG-928-K19]|nr:ABC transporter substrate-binding protein [Christensenellaceae bacterium OttesenSCG-928-K19]
MKIIKRIALTLATAFALLVALTGCSGSTGKDSIRIALVGMQESSVLVEKYETGMLMAAEEYNGAFGPIEIVVDNTAESDEQARAVLGRMTDDSSITAVVCLYSYDLTAESIWDMENAQKAFFAPQGYYTELAVNSGETFFPFSLSAPHLGYSMGRYAVEHGLKKVGCFHSGTQPEIDQATFFDSAAIYDGTRIVSSLSEPCTTRDISATYATWQALDVDAVFVPYYNYYYSGADIVRDIQKELPGLPILGSFSIDSDWTREIALELDGVVIPAKYPIQKTSESEQWKSLFEQKYNDTPENEHVQGYDIVNIIAQCHTGDATELSSSIRSKATTLTGVAGNTIRFLLSDNAIYPPEYGEELENDQMQPAYEYLTIREGKLLPLPGED